LHINYSVLHNTVIYVVQLIVPYITFVILC